jgi:hypothetical protein
MSSRGNLNGGAGDLPRHIDGVDAIVNLAGERVRHPMDRREEGGHREQSHPFHSHTGARSRRARICRECSSANPASVTARGDEPSPNQLRRVRTFWRGCASNGKGKPAGRVSINASRDRSHRPATDGDGGALGKMLLPFKLGLGSTIGPGDQFMPWMHINDWTGMMSWLIKSDRAAGVFNAAAPGPVTNRTFTHARPRPSSPRDSVYSGIRVARGAGRNGVDAHPWSTRSSGPRGGAWISFTHRTLEPALASLNL